MAGLQLLLPFVRKSWCFAPRPFWKALWAVASSAGVSTRKADDDRDRPPSEVVTMASGRFVCCNCGGIGRHSRPPAAWSASGPPQQVGCLRVVTDNALVARDAREAAAMATTCARGCRQSCFLCPWEAQLEVARRPVNVVGNEAEAAYARHPRVSGDSTSRPSLGRTVRQFHLLHCVDEVARGTPTLKGALCAGPSCCRS